MAHRALRAVRGRDAAAHPPFSEKPAITKTTLPKQGCKRTFWVYPSFLRR